MSNYCPHCGEKIDKPCAYYECDICLIPCAEGEYHREANFYAEGEDGIFCFEHAVQLGLTSRTNLEDSDNKIIGGFN